jgi:hypothetical protein
MNSTTMVATNVGSFAAHDQVALTALRGYGVSSGETMPDVRPLPQLGGRLLRTAVAVALAVGIAGEHIETGTSPDFSAEQGLGARRQPDQRSILASEIMAYRHLPHDWDGEGGAAPSKDALADALTFIDLLPLRAKVPKPTVSGEGEVGFYWKTSDAYVDVGFLGDGRITYYGRAAGEGLEAGDSRPFSRNSLPKDLLEIINRV